MNYYFFFLHNTIIPLEPTKLVTLNGCLLVSSNCFFIASCQMACKILMGREIGPESEGLKYVVKEVRNTRKLK